MRKRKILGSEMRTQTFALHSPYEFFQLRAEQGRRPEAVQVVRREVEKIYEANAAQAYLYACIAEPIGFLQRRYAKQMEKFNRYAIADSSARKCERKRSRFTRLTIFFSCEQSKKKNLDFHRDSQNQIFS